MTVVAETNATKHLKHEAIRPRARTLHESLPQIARERAKKASNPSRQIKTVYWRGDVISVVNRLFGYEFIAREIEPGQEWFWTDSWQRAIAASMESLEQGGGAVYQNEVDFLASLDE